MTNDFPENFLWGASTASHQVEGHTRNQWTEWEKVHASELAVTSAERLNWLPNWPNIEAQAEDPNNYISGIGVDHYERYKEDFDLLRQLNMNAFRFSLEWSRLEPNEGEWDQAALDHYRDYINQLRVRGIEPILTLWHWTMPVWLADKGGFAKRANLRYFRRFAAKIAAELAADLRYIVTINEPGIYTSLGYLSGEWPPQQSNKLLGYKVLRNLAKAHKQARAEFKLVNPNLSVGIAHNMAEIRPANSRNPIDCVTSAAVRFVWNWLFLSWVKKYSDFIGVNFYFTEYRDWRGKVKNPKVPLNDMGWYMEPSGLSNLLDRVWRRYHLPLLVTENGLADSNDTHRQWWLEETVSAMKLSLKGGVRLIGYLHWSLLDNFEWNSGYWPEFGLVAVDRENDMKRTIRKSAHWFADNIIT